MDDLKHIPTPHHDADDLSSSYEPFFKALGDEPERQSNLELINEPDEEFAEERPTLKPPRNPRSSSKTAFELEIPEQKGGATLTPDQLTIRNHEHFKILSEN
mmetsp:Transcript_9127/g.8050  ORF Transcript_9127/g.8050 Transcript_9127/m.8050 type:complete len:102 (+) Transcript_9127:59-364(+)